MTMTEPTTDLPEPEAIDEAEPRPEIVEQPVPAAPEPDLLPAVVERARHLIPGSDLPIIPGGGELRDLAAMAVTLAGAEAVPRALHGKPNDVFQVLLTARDLGVAVTTAMREFHVIDGRVTLSPKVKLAMVNERGVRDGWAVWPDPGNDKVAATWHATRRDRPGVAFSSTFTYEDAQNVGNLVNKDNWKRYPQRMLSWRALGYLLDDVFPEVATGIYSPDELGGMTDEEGRVIDVASADSLPGMTGPKPPPLDAATTLASEEVRFEIACRIAALPEESREALRERWKMNQTLTGKSVQHLPVTAAKAAQSILNGIETEAKRGGWDMGLAHAMFERELLQLAETDTVTSPDEGGDPPKADEEAPSSSVAGSEAPPASDAPSADGDAPGAAERTPSEFTDREQAVIDEVKAMKLTEVDAELRRLGLELRGSGQERRGSLAAAILAGRP